LNFSIFGSFVSLEGERRGERREIEGKKASLKALLLTQKLWAALSNIN